MWNKDRSIQFSILAVRIFFILWLAFIIFGYFIVNAYVNYNAIPNAFNVILITLYLCLFIVIFLLIELHKLLYNIQTNKVFVSDNVLCLRKISWFCLVIGCITLIATFGYVPFILVGIVFTFISLIVRVVKNVMEEAIVLKEENDYTI